MEQREREPKYAPGGPEDSIYTQKRKRHGGGGFEFIGLMILAFVLIVTLQDKIPALSAALPESLQSNARTVNTGRLDYEITSVDRAETGKAIYVNVAFANNTELPFFKVKATAQLYDVDGKLVDERAALLFNRIDAGEERTWTFCFDTMDYTYVDEAHLSTEYMTGE